MKPRWFGTFIIRMIMSRGATRITDLDGEKMLRPINMDRLQKYHIWQGKKKAYKVENLKGHPRQKLRQKDPARLKTWMDDLGIR